jgi:alkyl hydroperoxide reductase subunit AhpC
MQLGRSVDELLRVQKALIEIEKTGLTCPVDWQNGGKMLDYPAEDMRQMDGDWLQQSMKNFDF